MDAKLTWKYYFIPQEEFEKIRKGADELDSLRDKELTEDLDSRKEELIKTLDALCSKICAKSLVYKDEGDSPDGTTAEELIYRMDEADEVAKYSDEFYFHFMVYLPPEALQQQFSTIEKVLDIIEKEHLLEEEFMGEWKYLDRALEIFKEIRACYKEAYEKHWGIIKLDMLEWVETGDEGDEPQELESPEEEEKLAEEETGEEKTQEEN